jgi:hypothetical protein
LLAFTLLVVIELDRLDLQLALEPAGIARDLRGLPA